MRSKARIILAIPVLLIVVVLIGGFVFVRSQTAAQHLCQTLQSGLSERLKLTTKIESCAITLLPPRLNMSHIELLDSTDNRLIGIDKLTITLDSIPLLAGDLSLDRVVFEQPHFHLNLADKNQEQSPKTGKKGSIPNFSQIPKDIEIHQGRISLVLPNGWFLDLDELDSQTTSQNGNLQLTWQIGRGRLELADKESTTLAIKPSKCKVQLASVHTLDVAQCELNIASVGIKGHGRIGWNRQGLKPELAMAISGALSEISTFLPNVPLMDGRASISANIENNQGRLTANGDIDIKSFGIKTVRHVDAKMKFSVDREGLQVTNLSATGSGGRVTGLATFVFNDLIDISGSLSLEQADLIRSLAMAGINFGVIDLYGNGSVDYHGKLRGPRPALDVNLDFYPKHLLVLSKGLDRPVLDLDNARVQAEAEFTGTNVHIRKAKISQEGTSFQTAGTIRFADSVVNATFRSTQLFLEDLSPIATVPIEGTGQIDASIAGAIKQPLIQANIQAQDFGTFNLHLGNLSSKVKIQNNTLHFLKAQLMRPTGSIQFTGKMALTAPHTLFGKTELVQISLADLQQVVQPRIGTVGLRQGFVGGTVHITGSIEQPALDFQVAFADVQLGPQRIAEAGAIGHYEKGAWQLDALQMGFDPGWIYAQGAISANSWLDLQAYSTGLRATSFQFLDWLEHKLDFRLDMQMSIKGPLESPAFTGWAKFYDTEFLSQTLPSSLITAKATTEEIDIKGSFLGKIAQLDLVALLQKGLPFESTVHIRTCAEQDGQCNGLQALLVDNQPANHLRAFVDGSIKASGLLLFPKNINANLVLNHLSFGNQHFQFQVPHNACQSKANQEPCPKTSVSLSQGKISIKDFALTGPKTRLKVQGGGTLSQGPDLGISGYLGLGLLPLFVPEIPRATGQGWLGLKVLGSWKKPKLRGAFDIKSGRVRIRFLPDDLNALQGKLLLSEKSIRIDDKDMITARFGDGSMRIGGSLNLEDLIPQRLGLSIDLKDVRYQPIESLWFQATGRLNLDIDSQTGTLLRGRVRATRGEFKESISLVSFSEGLFRKRPKRTQTYDTKREAITFDIDIQVPDSFQAIYNLDLVRFQAELKGRVRLCGTNERLGLLGKLNAISGEVFYLSKEFEVTKADIEFDDQYEIKPDFDIQARRTETIEHVDEGKTNYRINLGLTTDEKHDLNIRLRSSPKLDESDIITLLSLGITSADMASLAEDSGGLLGLGGEIVLRSLKLDEGLSRLFPFPPEVIKPRYLRMRSRFSTKSNTTTPRLETGVTLRLISPDLDLDYSRSLYDNSDQSVELSYQLKPGVAISGRWEDADKEQEGDLGVDLEFRWEW